MNSVLSIVSLRDRVVAISSLLRCAAGAMILLGLASGCGTSSSQSSQTAQVVGSVAPSVSSQGSFLGFDAAVAEYELATQEFSLPKGYSFPSDPGLPGGKGSQYSVGYARGNAVLFWNCAWGKEYLEYRNTDEKRAKIALETFASVRDTDVFKKSWDPQSIQEPFEKGMEAAEFGDPSFIEEDTSANCGYVKKSK